MSKNYILLYISKINFFFIAPLKKKLFYFLTSQFSQISILYLISIATYAKLLEIYLPKTSIKIFIFFPFLKYLKEIKILFFINARTLYFLGSYFKYYKKYTYARIPNKIKPSKLILYNLNYLVVLDSIALLVFAWWRIFFIQNESLLKIKTFNKDSKTDHIETMLLTLITCYFIVIFVHSYIKSILGKFPTLPIVASRSAKILTMYSKRKKRKKFRY